MQKYSTFCETKMPTRAVFLCETESFSCYLEQRLFNLQLASTQFSFHDISSRMRLVCRNFSKRCVDNASFLPTGYRDDVQAPHKSHHGNKQLLLFASTCFVQLLCQFRFNLEQFEDARSHNLSFSKPQITSIHCKFLREPLSWALKVRN